MAGTAVAGELYSHWIDGAWVAVEGADTKPNIDPATGKTLGHISLGTRDLADQAIAAAKRALQGWKKVPAPVRARYLEPVRRYLTEHIDAIARDLSLEEGKLLPEAKGEVLKTLSVIEFMAGEGLRFCGYTAPSQLVGNFCYTVRQPLGVVGMITPWNFPLCIAAWKIAPALIAGNTVVLKPSELTPKTSDHLLRAFAEADLPPGVLNMVNGLGPDVGDQILRHPAVKAVSFTGSNQVGHHVYSVGASLRKKVLCEMGGKNPVVVLEDADVALAAAGAVKGAFGSTGQRCTATSRAIVHEAVADRFVELVAEAGRAFKLGRGIDEGVDMGPSVEEKQLDKVLAYLQIGKDEGATCVIGGERATEGDLANGFFPQPTLFDHVTPAMRVAKEEIFGPVLSVIRVKSFEEALAVANDVEYGLSSSLYTYDATKWHRFVDEIETGMTHLNSPTMGGESHMPFGGVKATGVGGREMGPTAIDFFCEEKTVYVDYTGTKREGNLY